MSPLARPWILVGVLTVLLLGGLAYGVRAEGGGVDIQQAYFFSPEPAGSQLNITASLFVTNHGLTRSDDLAVTAFVVPNHNGLAAFTTRLDVGTVASRTTRQVDVALAIPAFNASRSYRVDFLVFDDGLLTQRGSGSIGWGGHYAYDYAATDKALVAEAMQASAPTFERVG